LIFNSRRSFGGRNPFNREVCVLRTPERTARENIPGCNADNITFPSAVGFVVKSGSSQMIDPKQRYAVASQLAFMLLHHKKK
jgi:hypothetical protein